MAFLLRVRMSDSDQWEPATIYSTRKSRDKDAAFNRIIGGMRTHCWEERLTAAKLEAYEAEGSSGVSPQEQR